MADAEETYPEELRKRERQLLAARLQSDALKGDAWVKARHGDGSPGFVGLALSGGGIRSATFSLGFLQGLAKLKALRQIDFLSTVSGGTYCGAFLGALFQPRGTKPGAAKRDAEATLADPDSPVINHLRECGRYLTPGGSSDAWSAVSIVLRNLVAIHVVLWTTILTGFIALDMVRAGLMRLLRGALALPDGSVASVAEGLRACLDQLSGQGVIWWSPLLVLPLALVPFVLFPLGLAYWMSADVERHGFARHVPWISAVIVAIAAIVVRFAVPDLAIAAEVVLGESVAGAIAWVLARLFPDDSRDVRHRLSQWLSPWLTVVAVLLLVGAVDSLGLTVYYHLANVAPGHRASASLTALLSGALGTLILCAEGIQKLLGLLGIERKQAKPSLRVIAFIAAVLLLTPLLTGLSALSHGMVWDWQGALLASNEAQTYVVTTTEKKGPSCSVDDKGQVAIGCASPPAARPALRDPPVGLRRTFVMFLVAVLLTFLLGQTYSFLNRSTIGPLYAARLTRAYLGASNEARLVPGARNPTDLLPDDVIPLSAYSPYENGGPLHIINTTLNETIGGQSNIEEKDRKGLNLAIGPAGVSVGARHHATWRVGGRTALEGTASPSGFRVFPRPNLAAAASKPTDADAVVPESLDIGRWVGISGAAASTALGSMTSLGLSLLCGLLNVRLGHWWGSGVDPSWRRDDETVKDTVAHRGLFRSIGARLSRLVPVQAHLLDEFLARFPGTSTRNWYLTDGGHFENTGLYELVRRRLRYLIVLDNGADARGGLEDLAALVRKARLDFGATITFRDAAPEPFVGSLPELGFDPERVDMPGDAGRAVAPKKYAAIADVTYADGTRGTLLVVKPGIVGHEPLDVLQYRAAHPDFPQQTTADQFFDEAQWEAHRALGAHVAEALFTPDGTAHALGLRG